MIKLGKTKYHTQWGDLTANQIIKKLQKQSITKLSGHFKCTYCTIDVKFAEYHCAPVLLETRQEWALEWIAHNRSLAQFSQSI